jgi:quercetin dioxygenase-like cupin family protein
MEVESMRVRRWMLAFLVLTFPTLVAATAAQQGNDTPIAQNSEAKNFQTVPNVPECFTAAVQQGDPAGSSSVLLVKGKAKCKAPWHFHTPNEQVMMVSGVGRIEMKGQQAVTLHSGGFAYAPAKHVHQFTCASRPCSFFLRSDGPFDIHYVDQNGNEIPPEQALKK